MEKNPNNNIQSTDWEYTDDKLEIATDSSAEQKESKRLFSKNALRTFGAIALTATLALGMTGCGNKEAESVNTPSDTVVTEEAPVVEGDDEVIGGMEAESNEPEVIGEDSTDTLTISEFLEGIGSENIFDAFGNQESLDMITGWMKQNGYYDVNAEFMGDVPIFDATTTLQSDESVANVRVELSPGSGGLFNVYVKGENGERINTFQLSELPSSLQLNELIKQN